MRNKQEIQEYDHDIIDVGNSHDRYENSFISTIKKFVCFVFKVFCKRYTHKSHTNDHTTTGAANSASKIKQMHGDLFVVVGTVPSSLSCSTRSRCWYVFEEEV